MNEKIKAALQKIMADPDLTAQFRNCKSPDEAYAVAGGAEAGFTKEEFMAAVEELKAAFEDAAELSDEELAKAAGGTGVSLPESVTATSCTILLSSPVIVTW